MKTGDSYPTDGAIGVLLIGEPGSGKTCLAFEWPKPFFLDWDHNLRSGIDRYVQTHGGQRPWFRWDNPELGADGKKLLPKAQWERAAALLDEAAADPEVQTIVIDGLTRWGEALAAYVVDKGGDMEKALTVGGEKVMTKRLYQPYATLLTRAVMAVRASGKMVLVTAHIRSGDSELTEATIWQPHVVGASRNTLPGLFTDYWCCDTKQVGGATAEMARKYPTGVQYFVRTAPTPNVKLKNSLGLPKEFEFTWAAFEPFLKRASAPAVATVTPAK